VLQTLLLTLNQVAYLKEFLLLSCFSIDNAAEWHSSLFITNAANLMSSIKNVLKASKSAQALPNNYLPSGTSQATPQPHPLQATSATKPQLHSPVGLSSPAHCMAVSTNTLPHVAVQTGNRKVFNNIKTVKFVLLHRLSFNAAVP
jgi:hypothetical protein